MPLGVKPLCSSCKISYSPIWRKGVSGEVLCNSCGLKQSSGASLSNTGTSKPDAASTAQATLPQKNGSTPALGSTIGSAASGMPVLRKSSRIKPTKKAPQVFAKSLSTKGKGRRVIFKKTQPSKAPPSVATFVTGESVFHKDQYYQVGDVVSLVDHDGGVYYAQLRGFLSDQYNEKSAVITWLLPTVHSSQDRFDPNSYILGPEEDLPRKMEFMEFVCHAPSDYFRARDAPYKTISNEPNLCYIWTSIGPKITVTPTIDEIFGVTSDMPASPAADKSATKLKLERERMNREIARNREKSRAERRQSIKSEGLES
ncbi:GATA zinc finger domain-containing protein 1 [Elysia marginata]|uniref:GATA zinc finger domain-containing protein 1 n=1 Tax=Elysia marginata TaxID=1093978 RepID=A0AAV4JYD3_9GAST|nr:GATA zinc finger domain-containing protein 1 [Elysia marginata]